MTVMPEQRPYDSDQDIETPDSVLAAVKKRFKIADFSIDLAASVDNRVTERFYGIEQNSLQQSWDIPGYAWLNPPFGDIELFVRKAAEVPRLPRYSMYCSHCKDVFPIASNYVCNVCTWPSGNAVELQQIETPGAVHTLVLVPASTGANWWSEYVHGIAEVLLMNGRIKFKGYTHQYPKDCVLLHYGGGEPSYDVWRWKDEL